MTNFRLICGICPGALSALPADSAAAIVCDPPYGLEFMDKEWDHGVPGPVFWAQALRVVKPGAHLVAFGGTRTYHRLACAIEDAGWELRDCLMWLYGTGFPKSLDISKAIDKVGGQNFMAWFPDWLEEYRIKANISRKDLSSHFPSKSGGTTGCVWNWEHGIRTPSAEQFNELCRLLNIPVEPLEVVERKFLAERRGVTKTYNPGSTEIVGPRLPVTAPASDVAKQWEGWGTALKPAWEAIVLARKPLVGTVATNVLKHGTGGLNIDGCRIETKDNLNGGAYAKFANERHDGTEVWRYARGRLGEFQHPGGRWPANVVLDEEAGAMLDEQSGMTKGCGGAVSGRSALGQGSGWNAHANRVMPVERHNDFGGASRFFYCAKASRSERGVGNDHPTVKPVELMRWLVRLVTPPGGLVLDPFGGSGSTGVAAIAEGMHFLGIDQDQHWVDVMRRRLLEACGRDLDAPQPRRTPVKRRST